MPSFTMHMSTFVLLRFITYDFHDQLDCSPIDNDFKHVPALLFLREISHSGLICL